MNEACSDDDGEVSDHKVGRPEGSQPVAGPSLEDEVAEGAELGFVLGVAAAGDEVGENDDVIGGMLWPLLCSQTLS